MEKTLACYLSAIETVQKHAVELSPEEARQHRKRLLNLRRKLVTDHSLENLEGSEAVFEREVREYNSQIAKLYRDSKADVQQIMEVLRESTRNIVTRNDQSDRELRALAAKLEKTAGCDDLRLIRITLTEQVGELNTCIDSVRKQSAEALAPLHNELRSIEERLQEAERLASTDPLTDLFNRREGERRAEARVRAGAPFCLLVIDLNRFKSINDRYGHSCGDQVLQMVARLLETEVRPNDTLCRWGGDEFLIILECDLADAMKRSKEITRTLKGRFTVLVNGRKVDVEISASVGVACCEYGETPQIAFERADAMLYQMKHVTSCEERGSI